MVVTSTQKPSAAQLVIAGCIEAEGSLFEWELLSLAPDELPAADKRMIDRAPQRLPAYGGINPVQMGQEVVARVIVSARVGKSQDPGSWTQSDPCIPADAPLC